MPTLYKASNGLPNPLYTNPLARALTAEPRRPRLALLKTLSFLWSQMALDTMRTSESKTGLRGLGTSFRARNHQVVMPSLTAGAR
jgi:hypothetical protein